MTKSLSLADVRLTFQRAFGRWAAVIPITFVEINDVNYSDIKIGFYVDDGFTFNGLLRKTAHSFLPEIGLLHFDREELWVIDQDKLKFELTVDLETIDVHKIGHILGLDHSRIKSAIIYPTVGTQTRKVNLTNNDVDEIQQLYGANPRVRAGAILWRREQVLVGACFWV
ncbi:OLC1v1010269C1 [Oldenlandia corymbosa var. corymbosa]|uniref:OLC1v1010269C1 n=1 Tax=Oldenlandia corymbosa var. corymbosa TaxID=529605 RepID=A0AAV1DTN7_OLDCO|nr:OLC1v1010269C1 [Oldenlandia corymbosa var. corymbosa]